MKILRASARYLNYPNQIYLTTMATTLRPNQISPHSPTRLIGDPAYPLGATREMEPTTNRHGNAEYQCRSGRSVGIYVPRLKKQPPWKVAVVNALGNGECLWQLWMLWQYGLADEVLAASANALGVGIVEDVNKHLARACNIVRTNSIVRHRALLDDLFALLIVFDLHRVDI